MLAALTCALMLGAPATAAARVTVTLQFAFGAVAVGGVGFFIVVGAAGDLGFAGHDLPTALLEVAKGEVRAGVPVPALDVKADPIDADQTGPAVRLDLFRWRF
jgi:hypothetical protein